MTVFGFWLWTLLARAKQGSSKKFKGDEKMPKSKLHLVRVGLYASYIGLD